MATFSDNFDGRLKAGSNARQLLSSLTISADSGHRIHLMADAEYAEAFRFAAAAINGELGPLLDDLYEFCDDLGDGAPDGPPHAHRALNLAARLRALLPEPAKAEEPAV